MVLTGDLLERDRSEEATDIGLSRFDGGDLPFRFWLPAWPNEIDSVCSSPDQLAHALEQIAL